MKRKEYLLGLGFSLLGLFVHAQNGLEQITVEKYYVTTAADSIQADKDIDDYNTANATSLPHGALRVGAVTYRLYADMLPGYKLIQPYGDNTKNQILKINTSTTFYNHPLGLPSPVPGTIKNNIKNSLQMIDSYISLGGVANGNYGILKTEDDGVANNVTVAGNTGGVLLNDAPSKMGIALTTQDGMIAGTGIQGITPSGFTPENEAAINTAGNSFIINNGSWFSTAGSVGPIAATNRILIAQFTTNGNFHYEINVLVKAPNGKGEYYVMRNPGTNDNEGAVSTSAAVNITVNAPNQVPVVTITAPANGATYITGTAVAITAAANDSDGTVSSVEFFVDGSSVGVDNSAPYEASYTAVAGNHSITAKATDNAGASTTSTAVNINVTPINDPPTVSITAPADGTTYTVGANVAIAANAFDADVVSSVEFFVDGSSIGLDNTAPYEASYTAVAGNHALTAKATDNGGLSTTSSAVNITVNTPTNVAPTVSITAPANGATYTTGAAVAITATAADVDGTVASVEFFVDGSSVGVDNSAPYEASYTAVAGSHALTAKATDNNGASTTSAPVNITVNNASGSAYLVGTLTGECADPSFCLPIIAVDSVKNVIGYDLVLNYNPAKVHATGNVTVNPALINPSYTSVAVNNNAAAGIINIAVYLNGTAPASVSFSGVGELVCVEFTKDPSLLAIDTVSFSLPTVQESYNTGVSNKVADAGKYINKKSTAYSGSLKFWTDNSAIQYDAANPSQYLITNIYGTAANCTNKSATAVQPNLAGQFSYNITNGNSIQIERDLAPLTNVQPVINGGDAALANKILVNDLSFIPNIYQAIALDVNADGVISAGDVSQINQRSTGILNEFRQKWNYNSNGTSNGQLSKDWLFVDSLLLAAPAYKISTTYPSNDGVGFSKAKVPVVPFCLALPVSTSPNCPVYNATAYTGILLGDVNGNYDAVPHDGQLKKTANVAQNGTVYFNLDQATTGAGYIDVPVSFISTDNITSLDLAAQFNENVLGFSQVIKNVDYFTDALAHYSPDTKTLKFTSNSRQNYEADKNIISIRFSTKANIGSGDIFNVAAYLNGSQVKAELKGSITTGIFTSDNNVSVQVYPNPATSVINVVAPERAVVEVMDLLGKQVIISTMVNANQKQEISTENLANGMYMLKVYNDNFVSTQRIVIDNNK
jgi:hypothetical protein